MSHISSYKTEIRLTSAIAEGRSVEEDPGYEILSEAILAACEESNLDISYSIKDYYGRSIACDWGIRGAALPRGVGVKVDPETGDVEFIADTYGGYEQAVADVKQKVVQNFSTMCVVKALRELNYGVDMEEVAHPIDGKKVIIKGVL